MPISNVALTNTFDEWRTTTNQLATTINDLLNDGAPTITYRNLTANNIFANNINIGAVLLSSGNIQTTVVVSNIITSNNINVSNFVSNIITSNNIFIYGINVESYIISGRDQANVARTHANAAFANANNSGIVASAAFDAANAAGSSATVTAAFDQANTANVTACSAFLQANTARTHANGAFLTANAAFGKANNFTGDASNITTGTLAVARGGTGTGTTPTNGQLLIGNGTNYTLAGLTGTTNRITVTNGSGSVTLSGPQDLATSSSVQFGSFGVGTAASGTTGEIRATENITAYYSDKRLKTDIVLIENALNKIKKISGVKFKSNENAAKYGYINQKVQIGVIAQEIEQVLPEIVVPAPFDIGKNPDGSEYSISGENYKTVQYEKIIPLLIQAIKELKAELDELKSKGN
jgi:hypothetical protein